jgi:hypothetical protein
MLVVPAKAGTQGQPLLYHLVVQVLPLRILALVQFQFPGTTLFLDSLFAKDRIGRGLMKLNKYQPLHAVVLHKSACGIRSVLPSAASNIGSDADVQRAVALAREDVDARVLSRHTPIADPGPRFRGDDGINEGHSQRIIE